MSRMLLSILEQTMALHFSDVFINVHVLVFIQVPKKFRRNAFVPRGSVLNPLAKSHEHIDRADNICFFVQLFNGGGEFCQLVRQC